MERRAVGDNTNSGVKRIEYLFELCDQYSAELFAGEGKKKKRNAPEA
jgi:hypothetical protein